MEFSLFTPNQNYLLMNGKTVLTKMGGRIREIRKQKNLTQDKLATESQLEKAMISRIESGQTNLTVRTLYKISQALEIPIIEIFKDA